MAEDALVAILAAHVRQGEAIPAPSAARPGQHLVPVPPLVAAKLALYTAMLDQGVSNAQLAGRLEVSEEAVGRLLDPDYRSHLTPVMNALHAVGRALVVEDATPA
jgi:antitoxin HicB